MFAKQLELLYSVVAGEIVNVFIKNNPRVTSPQEFVDACLKEILENKEFTELCVTYLVTQVAVSFTEELNGTT